MGKGESLVSTRRIYGHQNLLDACLGLLKTLPNATAVPTATTAAAIELAAAEGEGTGRHL